MRRTIDVLSDYSERVYYPNPDYPVLADYNRLSVFADMCAASHWHDDLEFGVVLSGNMTYAIDGELVYLRGGEGVFVNSRHLHSNYSTDGNDCAYLCVLIHPSLLCATPYLEESFIDPLMKNTAFPFETLRAATPWQAELMAVLHDMVETYRGGEAGSNLRMQSLVYRVASLLYEHMPRPDSMRMQVDRRLVSLRNMAGFIQLHYDSKITLADIAAAGNVSVSSCCATFQRHLHQTPNEYLVRYRIEKSMALLKNPDLSITEIALSVGFSGASYFSETFRKVLGLSPSAYRAKIS